MEVKEFIQTINESLHSISSPKEKLKLLYILKRGFIESKISIASESQIPELEEMFPDLFSSKSYREKFLQYTDYFIEILNANIEQLEKITGLDMSFASVKSNLHKSISKPIKRIKLPPNKKEELNDKIVSEVRDLIDSGWGTQNKIFEELSKNSLKIFKLKLTAKQIEGRYTRNKNKF